MTGPAGQLRLQKNVPLSEYTTIGLGGRAAFFCSCETVEQLRSCLVYARENHLRVHIMGGGSNTIFPDEGFEGLVIRVDLRGITTSTEGNAGIVSAAAGESWDTFVSLCIEDNCAGIECLSGIPGFVGAVPIQNVGAYGQEVSDSIVSVKALDRATYTMKEFNGPDCGFAYRQSRFKLQDSGKFIITEVTFRLSGYGRPVLRYAELQNYIASHVDLYSLDNGRPVLAAVRSAVLALRRRKSMVIDPADPNAKSVGSFFINPVLSLEEFSRITDQWKHSGHTEPIPTFPAQNGVKVPAGWLVEKAGFTKGLRRGGAGISAHHSLALINCGGTSKELLSLAEEIRSGVFTTFGVHLEREPVVVK